MSRYKFLNLNPLGKRELDCVCRAISLGLELPYYVVQEKLQLVGFLFDCEALCVCCYKYLLDEVYDLQRIEEVQGMTVGEFAEKFPKGVYIVRVDGHCTCIVDSVVRDTWDCRDEIVDIVWKVE